MEIYKDLSNPASKEFEQLLNSQFTKTANLEEGKIITGVVNKVTDNFVFLEVPGLKSEPILDINELKSMGMLDKAKVGEKISVLLERLEDKKGEVLVSASKAQKIQGWDKLVEAYEKNEPIMGKITGRVKGGCIVEQHRYWFFNVFTWISNFRQAIKRHQSFNEWTSKICANKIR